MFAISEIPKEIGTVQAQKISWSPNSNEKAYSEPITLTDCATMQKEASNNAAFEISQSFKNRRPEVQFLCPVDLDSLHLQGNINSAESFQYVKLSVEPCESTANLNGDEEPVVCAPKSDIARQKINIVTLQA